MFDDFERYLKKNSKYINMDYIFLILGTIFYFSIITLIYLNSFINLMIACGLFIFLLFLISLISQKIGNFKEIKDKYINIYDQEYNCIKEYFINNNLYNKEIIKNFIEHYRMKLDYKSKKIDFITFITALSLLINYCIGGITPTKVAVIIIVIIIYIALTYLTKIIEMCKGELGLYSRLEENFSMLYAECINDEPVKRKK